MNNIAVSLFRMLLVAVATWLFAVPTLCAQESAPKKGDAITVAVLNLEGRGVDAELLETLTSVLRNEAQQFGDFDVVNQSPINLSEITVVLGCDTKNTACLAQAADQLEARVLIYGRVEKVEQAHKVTIEVFNATSAKFEQRLVHTIVNKNDPVVAFRRQIQSMFNPGVAQKTTSLQVDSSVTDAKIKLNGTIVGTVPLERKGLPPGTYKVEVYRDGYAPWRASVELTEGSDIRLWAPLTEASAQGSTSVASADEPAADPLGDSATPLGSTAPPPVSAGSGPNWGAWSAVGVGSLALGASLGFAGLMSSTQDDLGAHDARRDQMRREDYISERDALVDTGESYELAHQVLLGVGAVSIVAGTTWLLLDEGDVEEPMVEAPTWDVAVSPRGVSALVSW